MDIPFQTHFSTPLTNSSFLPLLLMSLSLQKHSPTIKTSIKDEYDYIVVGGGSAGSVVASRLSEESCVNVLLLEAGLEPPLLTEVPVLSRYIPGTDLDWKFKTVPQKHASGCFKNNQTSYIAGKMLGGSGSLNGMSYIRGNKKDYDYWEELGAKGWSYNDIFHYFLKLEDNRTPEILANGYHALGGPITVEHPRYHPDLQKAVSIAAMNMGYQFVDSNGKEQTGFYDFQANLRNNQRCSPVKGYLVPADKRSNLDISVNSFVTRLIFEDNKIAAVEYFNGRYQQVKVKREVIMTAGVLNTPKILMLSGIGPKEELNKLLIPVIADLPVGRNFHDHCGSYYYFTMDPRYRAINEKISDPANILQYVTNRSGPLSSIVDIIIGFLHRTDLTPQFDFPNFELYFGEQDLSLLKKSALKPEVYDQLFGPYENEAIFRCAAQNLHTRSRGIITLNSSNPFDPPLIDPNFVEDSRDLEDIIDGLKLCKKLLETMPLLELGVKPLQSVMPGCEMHAYDEDEYFRCYARAFLSSFNHPVGTAKMGDPSDPTVVVDPQLRVKGVKGLRVADTSVIPQVPSGNTLIPVLMIAEKASDMIRSSMHC